MHVMVMHELMECPSGDEHAHSGLDVQLVGYRVRAYIRWEC